jgi:hypothetical protein
MRRMKVPACFGPLSFSMFLLVSMASTQALRAQNAPASGTSVVVRMIDAVDSGSDPAGKQYRASVTKPVNTGNGVTIPQGAAATVTLTHNGSAWTTQLASVTINGQAVAVTSSSASVTSAAQSAAGGAVNTVNSVIGAFGHHTNAPAGISAIATGQRVVLPPGTTLTFVLSQPPASNPATPAVQPLAASAAPAPSATATSGASASGGVTTLVVCYSNINTLYLSAAFEAPADRYGDATLAFSNYLQAAYHYSMGVKCLPMFTIVDVGAAQKQLAGFAAQLKPIDTGWRPGQPAVAQGQSGFDPLAQGPGGIDLTQHRLTTYFCSLTAMGGTTMAVDQHQPNWNANETTYVSQVFQADWDSAPVSMAYKVFIRDHYVHDLNPSANLSPRCNAQSPAMQTSMHQTAMISNKRIGHAVPVDFTYTPAQVAEARAGESAAAAQTAALQAPTAAANQKYVFCHSAWAAGSTVPAGTVMYVSDIFPADMPPPVVHVPGHAPPPANANGAQINRTNALQTSFFAFLQKQYGYKDSGNYPTTCATIFPPTAGGLQSAQSNKQKTEDGVRQLNGQIVDTGWKYTP